MRIKLQEAERKRKANTTKLVEESELPSIGRKTKRIKSSSSMNGLDKLRTTNSSMSRSKSMNVLTSPLSSTTSSSSQKRAPSISTSSSSRSASHSPSTTPPPPAMLALPLPGETLKSRLVHLLAVGPNDLHTLNRMLRPPSRERLIRELDLVANTMSAISVTKKIYVLKNSAYKDVDIWKWEGYSVEDRQKVVANATRAFRELRLRGEDPGWKLLVNPNGEGEKIAVVDKKEDSKDVKKQRANSVPTVKTEDIKPKVKSEPPLSAPAPKAQPNTKSSATYQQELKQVARFQLDPSLRSDLTSVTDDNLATCLSRLDKIPTDTPSKKELYESSSNAFKRYHGIYTRLHKSLVGYDLNDAEAVKKDVALQKYAQKFWKLHEFLETFRKRLFDAFGN